MIVACHEKRGVVQHSPATGERLGVSADSMDTNTLIGLVAGTLTTIAFVPQLLKTWKSRSAEDVSLGMLVTFCAGVALWLLYGWLTGALPFIAANVVTLILALAILMLKLRYG